MNCFILLAGGLLLFAGGIFVRDTALLSGAAVLMVMGLAALAERMGL